MTKTARLLCGALPALAALIAATASVLPARAQVTNPDGAARQAQGLADVIAPHAVATPTVIRADEWWRARLHAAAAWRSAPARGKGVTVAVLSTGVDGHHPDLSGSVTTGPDFSHTGREPGNPYWGAEGTAVASLIAGHGHGPGGAAGVTGVAPAARILSVQVTLEYDDPLTADTAITRHLPSAIAAGIRYAVSHGATVIALPLDPGTLGSGTLGNPAAAGGSPAERAAVRYALAHDVLLVAPAGDNGASTGTANFPAAYPGVIAVGATARDGQLSPFTNTDSYVALTAPGSGTTPASPRALTAPTTGLIVAAPGGGYQPLASTDMAAALTAGVAALIRSRYPSLTVAEVTRAVERGTVAPPAVGPTGGAGWGHGVLSASRALSVAAAIAAGAPTAHSSAPSRATGHQAAGRGNARPSTAPQSDPGATVKSFLVDLVIAACVMSAVLLIAVMFVRFRRWSSARSARAGRQPRHARRTTAPRATVPQRPGLPSRTADPAATISTPRSAPPARTASPPTSLLAAPLSADANLPPWERPPGHFTSPPSGQNWPSRPDPNARPIYVWDPAAATGPLPTADGEEE